MMNKIFFWLMVIAFACTAVRELLITLPFPEDSAGWHRLSDPWAIPIWLRSFVDRPAPAADGSIARPMEELTFAMFDFAKKSLMGVVLPMIGGMTLMLGVMKVVEVGGGLQIIARVIRPVLVRMFPDVPPSHPAMGAMVMNLAANALGLGNAATPFGIRAMQELDKLNPHKGTATNAMALFLSINTAGVTLLATGMIVMRREMGSTDPAGVIGTTLFATAASTVVAIIVCKTLERFFPDPPATNEIDASEVEETDEGYPLWVSIAAIACIPLFVVFSIRYGNAISGWLMPSIVVGFLTFGYYRGVPVYETFIEGAKDGFNVGTRILPYLVAILVMVGMLTSSGAMDAFTGLVGPVTSRFGLPAEALPMALIRPLSGSGANGVLVAILSNKATGPDTYTGYLVSTIAGSSETTFYVIAVYYGSVQVKSIRHTLASGLIADFAAVVLSIIAVTGYFYFVLGRAAW